MATAEGDRAAVNDLGTSLRRLADAATARALASVTGKAAAAAERLDEYAEGSHTQVTAERRPPVTKLQELTGKAGKATGKAKEKVTHLRESAGGRGANTGSAPCIEQVDAGVPVKIAYDEWTKYPDFPPFLTAEGAEIVEEVPQERIVWRSKGRKGYVEGAVTFHELAPQLARIVVVLQDHPHGLIERSETVFRPRGRRLRSELKHFQQHVMTDALLHAAGGSGGKRGRKATTRKRKKAQGAKK